MLRRFKWTLSVPPILITFLCLFLNLSAFSDESPGGYDALRIENEYKLTVPNEETEAVWTYLKKRFYETPDFFAPHSTQFRSSISEEIFIDTYFDTSGFQLLEKKNGIRLRRRYIPNDKDNKKDGKMLLQIKLNRGKDSELNRTEFKYPVVPMAEQLEQQGYRPISFIKKMENQLAFKRRVAEIGLNDDDLRSIFTLHQNRRRVYISENGQAFATITLDKVRTEKMFKTIEFTEIELELNEIAYTEGETEVRKRMEVINASMKSDILRQFPNVKVDQTPKYNKAFYQLEESIPFFRFLLKVLA